MPTAARAKVIRQRSDLFSFADVLWEMAIGQLAFSDNTAGVIFDALAMLPGRGLSPILP